MSIGAEGIGREIVYTAELTCVFIVEYHGIEICFEGKAMPQHENKKTVYFVIAFSVLPMVLKLAKVGGEPASLSSRES
ncbi:hypothetical protein AV530_012435 [Patagioenas fasciata monilis]|uniref:Uncharacterized protein n=1 Tax=Patagioenas fasciata monilis TaxID=372326 RepID=A0A1V4JB91_PATFA|nr:hypothetical protein AV530_012435 [Patagioenas fasciata monilis]